MGDLFFASRGTKEDQSAPPALAVSEVNLIQNNQDAKAPYLRAASPEPHHGVPAPALSLSSNVIMPLSL